MPAPAAGVPVAVLSSQPPGPRTLRAAALAVGVSTLVFILLAPFAKERLPEYPVFLPLCQTALIINDLITAALLFAQLRASRSAAVLVLAGGYLYAAVVASAHLLSFPGLFTPGGLIGGGAQTTGYLFVFWHIGLPIAAIAYARLRHSARQVTPGRVWGVVAAALACALGAILLTTLGEPLFPRMLDGNRYSSSFNVGRYGQWVLTAAAAVIVWRSRSRSVLDVWLGMALFNNFIEIALVGIFNGGRYDLGFYAGRVYALLASCFVLAVLLSEQASMYASAVVAQLTARAEQQLRALADGMPQLAWIARPDGWITWYNRRWYEYTGRSEAEMVGWGWQAVHDPAALPEVLRTWRLSIATGQPFEMTFPLRGADGVFRPFLTRVSPFKDDDGRVLQWFGTNTDVSAQQAAQAALRLSGERKDAFLASLAHELRNPLAPIRNAVLLMQRMPQTPPEIERLRAMIDRQSRHLVRLVDDLLEIARISQGKIELRRELVSIRDAIDDAIEAVRPAIESAGIRLDVDLCPDRLLTAGDATRLTQVFANLLQNAAKFTPAGGWISVSSRKLDSLAEVVVRDSGIGIPPEHLQRIFEMFAQVEDAQRGGLGLGLALVRGFVQLHGGEVSARSEGRGRGAEFTVRLPLRELATPEVAHQPVATDDRRRHELDELDGLGARPAPS